MDFMVICGIIFPMEQTHWGLPVLFLYVFLVVLVLVDLGTKSSQCLQQTAGLIFHFSLNWDVI